MADSDEDVDRRYGRERFRRDRRESSGYGGGRGGGSGNNFRREGSFENRNRGSGYRDNRRNYSNFGQWNNEPPHKRARRDNAEFDDRGGGLGAERSYNDYSGGNSTFSPNKGFGNGGQQNYKNENILPPRMLLKQYVNSLQDDFVSEDEAIESYRNYKMEYHRQIIEDYFTAHKDEIWFKEKYHPEYSTQNLEKRNSNIIKRRDVFLELWKNSKFDNCRIHMENETELIKVMEMVAMKLEGATDYDLTYLDMTDEEKQCRRSMSLTSPQGESKLQNVSSDDRVKTEPTHSVTKKKRSGASSKSPKKGNKKLQRQQMPSQEDWSEEEEEEDSSSSDDEESGSSSSGSSSSANTDDEAEEKPLVNDGLVKADGVLEESEKTEINEDSEVCYGEDLNKTDNCKQSFLNESHQAKEEGEEGELEDDVLSNNQKNSKASNEPDGSPTATSLLSKNNASNKFPRPVHINHSLFLRTVPPTVSRKELESLMRAFPGFKRLALQDPQPEQHFQRRAWVTYGNDCGKSIKEYCWQLSNMRIKDTELGAIINRELFQRVRPISVLANNREAIRRDLDMARKLTETLDASRKVWNVEAEYDEMDDAITDTESLLENPLLSQVLQDLEKIKGTTEAIDNAEKISDKNEDQVASCVLPVSLDEDSQLAKCLDLLLLYLRYVHSVDFYSVSGNVDEDDLPHKCGIMHVRGVLLQRDKQFTRKELDDYLVNNHRRVMKLLELITPLNDAQCRKLGEKVTDKEVEIFIKINCIKQEEQKWLCPLSGKKFKGPDFVRKHIFNKHAEKVEQVLAEVKYFNNYLRDPRRPQLPAHPSNVRGSGAQPFAQGNTGGSGGFTTGRTSNPNTQQSQHGAGYNDRTGGMRDDNRMSNVSGGRGGYYSRTGGGRGGRFSPRNIDQKDRGRRDFGGDRYRSGVHNRGRGASGGASYNRRMVSYTDLDAPSCDDERERDRDKSGHGTYHGADRTRNAPSAMNTGGGGSGSQPPIVGGAMDDSWS